MNISGDNGERSHGKFSRGSEVRVLSNNQLLKEKKKILEGSREYPLVVADGKENLENQDWWQKSY